MTKGSGEDIYANGFVLLSTIRADNRAILRECLYKTSFNLGEAYLYLSLLNLLNKHDRDNEAVGLLYIMTATSFSVSLRKVIDKQSKRNIRQLVDYVYKGSERETQMKIVSSMYSGYSPFIDQVIVHQDEGKITLAPQVPSWTQNKKDLDYLAALFDKLSRETCSRYIRPRHEHKEALLLFKKMISV